MRLTLAHQHGERSVIARVDDTTTVADLSRAVGADLAAVCEVPARQAHLVPVSETPLLSGAYLTSHGTHRTHGSGRLPGGAIRLEIIGGPFAGRVLPLAIGHSYAVGSGHGAWLRLPDPLLEDVHARIDVGESAHRAQQPSLHAPPRPEPRPLVARLTPAPHCVVQVNGVDITAPAVIAPIDVVLIGSSLFRLGIEPESDADTQPSTHGMRAFNRPSRILAGEATPTVTLPGHAPDPPELPPLSWLSAAIPIILGVVMAAIFARPTMLLMAAASPIMVVGSFLVNRRIARRQGERAHREWLDEVSASEARIESLARAQRSDAWYASPDPLSISDIATKPLARLWERRLHDPDALVVRVGTATMPLNAQFQGGAHNGEAPEVTVGPVPITVDFARGPVGIAGEAEAALRVARALMTSLAVLRSPRDLNIVLLCGEREEHAWGWIAWLPHLRSATDPAGPAALIGNTDATRRARLRELSSLVQQRKRFEGRVEVEPQYLVVIDRARDYRSLPGMVDLLSDGPPVGVHTIALETAQSRLPEECKSQVTIDGSPGGSTAQVASGEVFHPRVLLDGISFGASSDIARSLCSIDHVSGVGDENSLPASCRYVDLVGTGSRSFTVPSAGAALLEQWNNQPTRTHITVGSTASGEFALDLVADGPHALVAGTTGSGKSEFLQTLVISLALANRPDALSFVLIDYKGGSAFADCRRLPHTVGMVTNLDTRETERALESLSAELRRRETVLGEMGAKDLDTAWQRDSGEASRRGLSRLVLVIDEFAELKTELPDFINGLVRIARVGRSLGVHLVLATQRPSGIVTPEMQSNINLRVALRVTDRADSIDILGSGEASQIPASLPGRGYVRSSAGGPPAVFQTARVASARQSAVTEDPLPVAVAPLRWEGLGHTPQFPPLPAQHARRTELNHDDTDLRMLADLTVAAATLGNIQRRPSPWLQPLPTIVPLDQLLADPIADGDIVLGLQDLPAQQSQHALRWNPVDGGHLLFIGGPRSGRTSALRTMLAQIIMRHSPSDLHLYVADFGNGALLPLTAAPHCGAVITPADVERLPRLMHRLTSELERRQAALSAAGVGNVEEQRVRSSPESAIAYAIFAIDGWEHITTVLSPDQCVELREQLLRVLREGPACGIRVLMTTDRTCLGDKIASAFDTKYLLPMRDSSDYRAAGVPTRVLPTTFIPGRMLSGPDGTESQVALLSSNSSGEGQTERLRACVGWSHDFYVQFPQLRRLPSPIRVDPLPSKIELAQAHELPRYGELALQEQGSFNAASRSVVYGVGGDILSKLALDWHGVTGFVAAGSRGSGRSSVLVALLSQLHGAGRRCLVVAPKASTLSNFAHANGISVVSDLESDIPVPDSASPGDRPVTLFVDDAELLANTPAERSIASNVSRISIVMSVDTESTSSLFGGVLASVKQYRQGVILAPGHSLGGTTLFGAPIPKAMIGARSAGRGVAFVDEAWVPIRIPHLSPE